MSSETITIDDDPNADAIYAALVHLRDYAESDEGQAAVREVMDRRAAKVDFFRSLFRDAPVDGRLYIMPKFEYGPKLCEEIYVGEQESVEFGLELARRLIWGPAAFIEDYAQSEGPPGEATRRFIADRAN